jgi:DNA-directed RNA polymerase subunit RPC12/RpoP
MEPTDEFRRVAIADVFCGRCSRPMAIQRLRYADPAAGFSSIDYKCLSCGERTYSRISLKLYRRQPISFARVGSRLAMRARARKG